MANPDDKDAVADELTRRSIGREILSAAAEEMGFAVNSIRQEVVEKGWFGERTTPEFVMEWEQSDIEPPEIAGAQDFRREDLYGHDPEIDDGLEHQREQDLDR